MADRVKIVGGSSLGGRITIVSDKFSAKAVCDSETGAITCHVKKLGESTGRALSGNRWFIPKTVRLVAFLLANFIQNKLLRTIVGIWIWAEAVSAVIFPGTGHPFSWDNFAWILVNNLCMNMIFITLFCLLLNILTWHGAEHMAITAYHKSGSTAIADIEKESRVDPHCGGRFILPFILCNALAVNSFLLFWIAAEVMLWIDALVGLWEIPPFGLASRLLQKYITTAPPGTLELRTAQTAMQEIVKAHEELALETAAAK